MAAKRRGGMLFGFAPVLAVVAAFGSFGFENKYNIFIPFVSTPEPVVTRMLELADVGSGDLVLDLGSGDGRIPILAAARFGARARGVDIDPALVKKAADNAAQAGVADRVEFRREDMFRTEIADASVLTLYVLTQANLRMRPRILSEMRPGARIVSHAFGMGAWSPDRHDRLGDIDLYLWIVPARVAGEWEFTDGVRGFTVALAQQFQRIEGTVTVAGRAAPIRQARLRGHEIELAIALEGETVKVYRGRIDGERIVAGEAGTWSARRVAARPVDID